MEGDVGVTPVKIKNREKKSTQNMTGGKANIPPPESLPHLKVTTPDLAASASGKGGGAGAGELGGYQGGRKDGGFQGKRKRDIEFNYKLPTYVMTRVSQTLTLADLEKSDSDADPDYSEVDSA